ncbi:MAG: hypothetical protein ACRDG8_09615 [Actinomycetota bacterium]
MRGRRSLVLIATIGTLGGLPVDAAANGGAYLDLDRTHYLPGDTGIASTYVRIPEKRRSLLDAGPFYLFLLPRGAVLDEGEAIPTGAMRLGTFEFEQEKGASFELRAPFTMPEVASGYYDMGVCNDPCTITGFREGLSGAVSVVATRREAQLLRENGRLGGRVFGFRREARRAERRLEQIDAQLDVQLGFARSERERLTGEIARLEEQLASARSEAAAAESRPAFDPQVIGAILLLTGVAAVLAFRRRRMTTELSSLDALEDIAEASFVSRGPEQREGNRGVPVGSFDDRP